jgi:hypothetical protein
MPIHRWVICSSCGGDLDCTDKDQMVTEVRQGPCERGIECEPPADLEQLHPAVTVALKRSGNYAALSKRAGLAKP